MPLRTIFFCLVIGGGARQDTDIEPLSGVASEPQFKKAPKQLVLLIVTPGVAFFQLSRPCLGKLHGTMCPNDNRSFVLFSDELTSVVI